MIASKNWWEIWNFLLQIGLTYFLISVFRDNPDVDIKGANLYKEHLLRLASTRRRPSLLWSHMKAFDKVESILVCTGVYSKQSCLDFHLEALLLNDTDCNNNVNEEAENKNRVAFYQNSNNSSTASLNTSANSGSVVIDKHELKRALSRKNSFIQYFEDRYNQPDLCVDNLLDAVNYIVGRKILMAWFNFSIKLFEYNLRFRRFFFVIGTYLKLFM